MTYHFDSPPSRDGIIQEFGIHPERLHQIETFTRHLATNEDNFDYFKLQYTREECAFILKQCNLIETFALLCSIPNRACELMILVPDMFPQAVRISALFDQKGMPSIWLGGEACTAHPCPWSLKERQEPPSALLENEKWSQNLLEVIECLQLQARLDSDPCVGAVASFPMSEVQWRRKFVSERWWHPGLKITEHLNGSDALAEWNLFIKQTENSLKEMDRFAEWAIGQESWDGLPPAR